MTEFLVRYYGVHVVVVVMLGFWGLWVVLGFRLFGDYWWVLSLFAQL